MLSCTVERDHLQHPRRDYISVSNIFYFSVFQCKAEVALPLKVWIRFEYSGDKIKLVHQLRMFTSTQHSTVRLQGPIKHGIVRRHQRHFRRFDKLGISVSKVFHALRVRLCWWRASWIVPMHNATLHCSASVAFVLTSWKRVKVVSLREGYNERKVLVQIECLTGGLSSLWTLLVTWKLILKQHIQLLWSFLALYLLMCRILYI